jgi:hypothetical protein
MYSRPSFRSSSPSPAWPLDDAAGCGWDPQFQAQGVLNSGSWVPPQTPGAAGDVYCECVCVCNCGYGHSWAEDC